MAEAIIKQSDEVVVDGVRQNTSEQGFSESVVDSETEQAIVEPVEISNEYANNEIVEVLHQKQLSTSNMELIREFVSRGEGFTAQKARNAIVMSEIIGPPLSKRKKR